MDDIAQLDQHYSMCHDCILQEMLPRTREKTGWQGSGNCGKGARKTYFQHSKLKLRVHVYVVWTS